MALGLIIQKKWLEKIFLTGKTWEMRSSLCHKREVIKLIESKSGLILGECRIIDSFEVSREEAARNIDKHQVEDLALLEKWKFAWVLSDVVKYETPQPYKHKQGQVIWVRDL